MVLPARRIRPFRCLAGGTSRFPRAPPTGPLRGQAATPPVLPARRVRSGAALGARPVGSDVVNVEAGEELRVLVVVDAAPLPQVLVEPHPRRMQVEEPRTLGPGVRERVRKVGR